MDVAAIGEVLIDFTETGKDGAGYPILAAHPGGAPCNYLAALAKAGKRVGFIGKTGDDKFGALLRETLQGAGIDVRGLISGREAFTTLAFVTLDGRGERAFSFARKPGADTMLRFEEIDLSLIDEARVLHFGTLSLTDEPSRGAVMRAVEYARERGKLISFDPNCRPMLWPSQAAAAEAVDWGLRRARVAKLSEEEAAMVTDAGPEACARLLTEEYGVSLAMVTLGAEGYLLRTRTAQVRSRPPAVAPVDTTGAGDIFGGSAMARLLELGGEPERLTVRELQEIADFACAAAALSTRRPGGMPSVPERAETERFLTSHLTRSGPTGYNP